MTEPLKPETPAQVGSVVGVDRMDSEDRSKLDVRTKLELLATETKNLTGRDPRGGGYAFVGRPSVMLQLFIDGKVGPFCDLIELHKAVVVGSTNGDVVGWWQGVPLLVRCNAVGHKLYCVPLDQIPEDKLVDRRQAGALRLHAWNRKLEELLTQ